MNRVTSKVATLALIGLSVWAGEVRADKAQLEGKLEQELSIQLEDVTIAQALDQIGQRAGLEISLSPEAVWKLPEGRDTRLSVTLEGRLSESLDKMLRSFFLRYAVGSESLTIYPRPELRRIIGRPTAEELQLLTRLYGNPMWFSIQADTSESQAERFAQAVFKGVMIMPPEELSTVGMAIRRLASKASPSSAGRQDPNAPKGAPMTLALFLEGVERSGDRPEKTWYIQGLEFPRQVSEIWIVPREEFWKAHLDQIVDLSFENEKGEAIIRQLALWADLDLTVSYPLTEELSRRITLQVQNVKLQEAMEKVLSTLGVAWNCNISTGTISLHGLSRRPERPAATAESRTNVETASAGDYVGKISIPMDGGKYFIEFMLRESDLTEELRRLRQEKVREIIERLSKAAKEQAQ